jgi:hypothetical protein
MTTPSENLRKHLLQNRYLRNLKNIEFPVYKLDGEPIEIGKVLFVNGFPIDDLNIKKPTLALRRLHSKIEFKKISNLCMSVADIIRSLKGQENWFIDNYGLCFKYVRTSRELVKSHKVTKVSLRETYCIVTLDGVDYPFIEPRPPIQEYARVLYYKDAPWLILEYTKDKIPTSTKKV